MVQKSISTFTILFLMYFLHSQTLTQTIRGQVIDKESKTALYKAKISILNSEIMYSFSDTGGYFTLPNVPIGRQSLQVELTNYNTISVLDLQLSSAKEIVLLIELEELTTQLKTVNITASNNKLVNGMIGISGRSFSLNEANRFAGSQNDPARMARNYAGVSGASDQRNDIIIRGNSPQGLLWRIEGIPVPNPNHFAGQGTTGGPISIINYKLLSNSDFITGAFPAEYGNAISGVFDIKMRNGNTNKIEKTVQAGALGLEAIVEGPFSKKNKSTYLIAYRYSTLSLLTKANIKIGFASIPTYQDLSFKFNWITKKAGTFTLFGLGGNSSTVFLNSKRDENQFSPANKGENVQFGSKTAIIGLSNTIFVNPKTFIKTTLAYTFEGNGSKRDTILTNNNLKRTGGFGFSLYKFILNSFINKKVNNKNTIQTGIVIENIYYQTKDSLLLYHLGKPFWGYNNNFSGNTNLIQAYSQWKYKINSLFTLNSGLHFQFLTLNNKWAIEPRASLNYKAKKNQVLSVGFGLHNQVQPYGMYFYTNKFQSNNIKTNTNLRFTTSQQLIIGYDKSFKNNIRLKVETYYQYLTNVPVETQKTAYSTLNFGATFYNNYKDSLVNKGIGNNYGLEITFEKFYSKNYYFLLTTSLFNSTYKGSDGQNRNTAFNGNYVINTLGGYELKLKNNLTLMFDAKFTIAGGLRYTPIDLVASKQNNEAVYKQNLENTIQNKVYFKPDFKFTVRKSYKRKIALEWALDLQNVANYKNVFLQWYDKNTNEEHPVYQNGFFPTFQFKIEF